MLTILYWQAPSLPNSYLSSGTNDVDARASTLERLDIVERTMKTPITMCHGIRPNAAGALRHPLTEERFDALMGLASELGLQSINYDQPAAWREGSGFLPERPIMIDFDHPVVSMRREVFQT